MTNKIKNQTIIRASALFWITIYFSNPTFSQQNLIVNPDFEILSGNPYNAQEWSQNNNPPYPITGAGWMSVHATVEWWTNLSNWIDYTPLVPMGYNNPCAFQNICVEAYSGNTCIGMFLYYYSNGVYSDERDLLRGTFETPLIPGKNYQLKFFVNSLDFNCRIKEIAVSFANNLENENVDFVSLCNLQSIQHQSLTQMLNSNFISCKYDFSAAKNTWVPVIANFTAQGDEKYFYIHNWNLPLDYCLNSNHDQLVLESTADITVNNFTICDYVLLDNFSLTEKPFFPNVITTDTDSLNSNFHYSDITVPCHVSIYNRWGTEIAAITPENPYFYSTNPGTYYYTGTCDKWEEKGYFEIITK